MKFPKEIDDLFIEQRHAILDENGNVLKATLLEWASWLERIDPHRFIQQDMLLGFKVSTVFLGINYQFDPDGPPLWFETMIFDRWKGEYSSIDDQPLSHCAIYVDRYATLAEAKAGHAQAISWLQAQPFYYQLALPQ